MNYYQIHKNKKPKRLKKRKFNHKNTLIASIIAANSLRISQIQSNVNEHKALRAVKAFGIVLNTAKQIQNIYSRKQGYLDRNNKTRN